MICRVCGKTLTLVVEDDPQRMAEIGEYVGGSARRAECKWNKEQWQWEPHVPE